ncbi:ATP-binding cassette sub-family A member 10 isoform X3 [Moschus berezovskii]|uniref:ATP-binding cassette sub-family A member 10 isoform X3 n=1 Tax=Moschus berezovskii TaxID=68408 RepID=UPI002443CF10|nr:ATP-binding cassette sub-family A member 10 isoform X3 [Moschus berezovskii]
MKTALRKALRGFFKLSRTERNQGIKGACQFFTLTFLTDKMIKKERSVCQQTRALLHKNFLRKWRMKKESVLEWALVLLPGLALCLFAEIFRAAHFLEQPPQVLGRVDEFNDSDLLLVAYTPVTNVTQSIMDKVAAVPFMKGRTILGIPNEDAMDRVRPRNDSEMVGIVFNDTFSYRLKFSWGHRVPILREHFEYSDHCWAFRDEAFCLLSIYWQRGFVAFQTAINAAIIEVTANHSVMEELISAVGINMRTPPFISKGETANEWFIFICIMYFSPFVYVASLNITKERKKFKKLMTGMGLQQSAFWLSWALVYAAFILVASMFMTLVIKLFQMIILTGFMVVVTLFTLYGLSLLALAFLLCVLIRRPILTGMVGCLFTVFWGCLGFTTLYRQLPSSLGWALCLFSPFAFTAGVAQISHQEYHVSGVVFPDPSGESHAMIVIFFLLAFDTLLYLTLALYFEHILPDENGQRHSPLFFLKSSFWSQHKNPRREVFGGETNSELSCDDSFEPVSPEFHGKEAIRIRNLKKEYEGKPEKVEALQGICLDIYEGQLTAILGHSGAGKSSLLSILGGWSVCTEGSATIYNTQLSEIMNMEEIRNCTGFCPQFNIYFDFLTVRENLRLFAKIKGIPPKEVEQEVKGVMLELDMHNIQDVIAGDLSGGQKRKLTFGIAILGDPQVLLLDEPTVGLDPFSRHLVWNFLKERKTNHTILFSTQFMDEADILADRKVFLSNGKLRCAGSSSFLKRKWGIGYHLSLHRKERCNTERITSLITQHISDAKLTAESEEKLVYTLPLERTDKFPDLCRDLENSSDQGIMNFGVSMTTLSEVFLNLKGRSAIDESDPGVGGPAGIDVTPDPGVESEVQQALRSLPEVKKATSSAALWRRQVCAVARLRFLKLRNERKIFLSLLVVFGIALIPTVCEKIVYSVFFHDHRWEFSPGMYFLSLKQLPQAPLTNLLIINNTGSNIEDVVQSLKRQNLVLEVDDARNRNGSDDPSYNGAIIVSGGHKDYRFSVACNTKRMNCFPVLIGIISNALLGIFNVTELIRTERSTFPPDYPRWAIGLMDFLLLFIVNCLSPFIGMSSVSDYKQKARAQLRISGLCPSAYWCGQALVDIPFYFGILVSIHLMYYIFFEFTIVLEFMFALVVCVAGCAACLVLLTYVISLLFPTGRKNNGFWSLSFFLISLFMLIILGLTHSGSIVIICILLIPSCTSIFFLSYVIELSSMYHRRSESQDSQESAIGEIFLLAVFIPYLQIIIFLFIIRCLEMKYGKETMRKDPFFRISPRRRKYRPNPEEPEEEDEDVQTERVKTANALAASSLDEPVVMASCLHKEYKQKKKRCFSARKTKTAIRNVSFCINKGEVLGLLGHNGAGKSTSIKMITGDAKPTAGVVVFSGSGTPQMQQEGDGFGRLGYCPQEDALWPEITVREHLDLYAAVKGLAKEEAALSISRLADALKLQDQMALPTKALPEGAKRKLSFALSVLGSPAVLLLDEPTTGMDPEGQLQMWQAIQAIVKSTARGALLTTHSMAEAEAVCDRVAIMVSGRLRCIGSVQHLKSKFGKDYLLEVKVKVLTQVEPLHMEILKLFPQAARQERYSFMMAYKLPIEDVHPLSQTFSKLEAVKQTFDLEEYSLSQATLEQVFLELSKEQELGNLDDDVDSTVRWKLLPQEES